MTRLLTFVILSFSSFAQAEEALWKDNKLTPAQPFPGRILAVESGWGGYRLLIESIGEGNKKYCMAKVWPGVTPHPEYTEIQKDDLPQPGSMMVFLNPPVEVDQFSWSMGPGKIGRTFGDEDCLKKMTAPESDLQKGKGAPGSADSPAVAAKPYGIADPRRTLVPVILYQNEKQRRAAMEEPLLIFARWDIKPSNQILGVERSFTDEQIIAGLRKFYREWRAPADDSTRPRPQLIFAQQNWGCGAQLYESLKELSAEFEIDVYQMYPVINGFGPASPAKNDQRLAELSEGN